MFNLDVFCEVVAFVYNFPALGMVCRGWYVMLQEDTIYLKVVARLAASRGVGVSKEPQETWRGHWLKRYFHVAWRPAGGNLMVDFINSVIENLSNDEGTLSQIYYTYPRVGLQFKQKFALFEIMACHSLARTALKKGTHLREEPCVEKANFLAMGLATDRIIKLDFVTTTETKIVVWTSSTIELFTYKKPDDLENFTIDEIKTQYHLCPLTPKTNLPLTPRVTHQVLVIHINTDSVITLLSHTGKPPAEISCYSFETGKLLYTSNVPGVIRPGVGGEWKSRERFEFKGSVQIGALVDDSGVVRIFHHATRTWCAAQSRYWELWKTSRGNTTAPSSRAGPRPRYVRTTGCHIVVWNAGTLDPETRTPPFYVEIWRCVHEAGTTSLQLSKVLAECYTTISSVHIDDYRCYVNIILENKDVLIDVWDLCLGTFVCRVHAVNNSWSMEKEQVRTHLSKIFWSSDTCLIYYELNTKSDNTNALSFRQLSCVPEDDYWETCRSLKGNDHLKRETHQILSTTRPQRPIHKVWPSMASSDPTLTSATVTDAE